MSIQNVDFNLQVCLSRLTLHDFSNGKSCRELSFAAEVREDIHFEFKFNFHELDWLLINYQLSPPASSKRVICLAPVLIYS